MENMDMPSLECKYLALSTMYIQMRKNKLCRTKAKQTELNQLLLILHILSERENNIQTFAWSFVVWESKDHLHKKDEQPRYSQSSSKSDDTYYQP